MFKKTALRLTLQYTVILILAILIFSASIYAYMNVTFGGNFVNNYQIGHVDPLWTQTDVREVTDAGLTNLRNGLLIFDGTLLIIIPFIAYALSKRSLKPLKDSYELQESFTDNASHELRTPLTVISGELELALQKPRSKKEYAAAIQRSLEETRNLITLSNQLLLLARGDTGTLSKTFKTHKASSLINGSITSLGLTNDEISRINVDVSKKISIYGNNGLLRRAIGNVVGNAVKFTPTNGNITVSCQQTGTDVQVIVRDNGKGMTEQDVAQAFNRFWRSESARTASGHGLGLSITERIVRLHGGKVIIDSSTINGTTVVIFLPKPKR